MYIYSFSDYIWKMKLHVISQFCKWKFCVKVLFNCVKCLYQHQTHMKLCLMDPLLSTTVSHYIIIEWLVILAYCLAFNFLYCCNYMCMLLKALIRLPLPRCKYKYICMYWYHLSTTIYLMNLKGIDIACNNYPIIIFTYYMLTHMNAHSHSSNIEKFTCIRVRVHVFI